MRLFETFLLALRNLRGYLLRSLLTTLGVVFGIASVVTMMALGRGAEEQILREFDRMGITNIIVKSVKPPEDTSADSTRSWVSQYGLTFADLDLIRETVGGVRHALPVHSYDEHAWEGSERAHVRVRGVTPEYLRTTRLDVARGRGITADDELHRRPVAVVHASLLRSLGVLGEPLGHRLRIGELVYEVVGVLRPETFQGLMRKALADPGLRENEVYVPYSTVLTRVGTRSYSRGSGSFQASDIELNQIVVEVERRDDVRPVAHMLRRLLATQHEERDYELVVPIEVLAQRRRSQQVFNVALLLIAGISLLVGGIGIANIMLATVTERTREIGVRRAIGARRIDIVVQFLMETVVLSVTGGILGVALGQASVSVLAARTEWHARITPDVAAWALGVSCLVGVLSGVFPAIRASRLDPIQALRHE